MHNSRLEAYKEDDWLTIGSMQHFEFCRRQWALMYVEQQWEDNLRTVEGELLHQKVHDGYSFEKRKDVIISRGMPVFSSRLGLRGVCDVVEFHQDDLNGAVLHGRADKYMPYAVEFKKGAKRADAADILQAAAQSLCLEEMLCVSIPKAYVFHIETREKEEIPLTEELREYVKDISKEMHEYYRRGYTPKVKPSKSCNACSLKDICMPKLCKNLSSKSYIKAHIDEL